ncbi:MAG: ABC transporter permease [Deltaproteobacteria bacterium]|nr:ABC transporter permease [Deltaproteobacteria bacterium]
MNYRYVVQELRHHRHRTLVNILGIGIGIALFVAINAVSSAYQEAVSLPFRSLGTDIVVQRPEKRTSDATQQPASMRGIRLPFSNQVLSQDDLNQIETIEGIDSSAKSLLLWEFDKSGFRTIMGVDASQPSLGPVKAKEWIKEGRFPQKHGEVLIEKHYAKFIHKKVGDNLEIGGKHHSVVGLLEIREGAQVASANMYLPLADAQSLMNEGSGGVNVIFLRLKSPSLLGQVKMDIVKKLNGVSVTSSDSLMELMGGVSKISDQFSLLVSIIAFGGAVLLIIKTMLSNLVERSREIGVLKAVGWTEKDIQKQLMGEAFLQSLLGGLGGLLMGYILSFLLGFLSIPISTPWELNLVPAFAKNAETAVRSVRLPVSISFGLSAVSILLSLTAGGLASYAMGKRASRMKPAEILRQL